MKHTDRIKSSIIIALVAGFIYYAFSDFETIIKFPSYALEKINSVIEKNQSVASENNSYELTESIKSKDNSYTINTIDTLSPNSSSEELSDINFLTSGKFREELMAQLPTFEKLGKLESTLDIPAYSKLVWTNYGNNEEFLDSIKIKINLSGLDSLNKNLSLTMEKLNESLSKLSESFSSQDFNVDIPEIDLDSLGELGELKDLKIEIDLNDIKKELEESMKEFNENKKNFDIDMKEFQDSMKKFKENMKDLKEQFKNKDSSTFKNMNNNIIES